mgnify:CR=1 FL=1
MSKILIVEDDEANVIFFAQVLEDNGYEVAAANDTVSARDAVARFSPDAILIDVLMPGRSGLDLLVSLRRDPRWTRIPLVVITGSDKILEDDCQSYLGAHEGVSGPDGVLGKPVDRATLLAILDRLLG